ncbi:hypothetical protein F2Q70_00022315 [Brassica cretica]|uniref:Uncharacterized protein n=1 Tax=Brassica cretica TaxID=69181 RepID=A0A8S9GZG7_BRACR|nr:hypothetical protein F2Q70_00022315 [Brassica cretica]
METTSQMSIPLLVLQWPATLEESQHEEVSAIEEGETWMTPLVRYLENDILPEDYNKSRKIKNQAASLDLLDGKREAARLTNWSYQQDVARTYNNKVRTQTFRRIGVPRVPHVKRSKSAKVWEHIIIYAYPDVESCKVWHLGPYTHTSATLSLIVASCRSIMQHMNSIVATFRAPECEIQIGTGSSLA